MSNPCKVCEILRTLTQENAHTINEAILNRKIAAPEAARLLSRHISPVGQTTVKVHRKAKHLV